MDKRLLISAFTLLFIEVFILLADLQLLPVNIWSDESAFHESIGEVVQTKEYVRRKKQSSIIWENSENKDALYAYDSILTLDNSSAQIQLDNDSKITVFENTLIVLEPETKASGDKQIKLLFSKGNLRARSSKHLQLATNSWTLDTTSGADISLKSVSGGELQIEVSEGTVNVVNNKNNTNVQIESGVRASLDSNDVKKKEKLSSNLIWPQNLVRKYSFTFPVRALLNWKGRAKTIRYFRSGEEAVEIPVEYANFHSLQLNSGTYYFTLHNGEETSKTFTYQILPAPKTKHFSPLPRDRIKVGSSQLFSWLKNEEFSDYRLEFSKSPEFTNVEHSFSSKNSIIKPEIDFAGAYYWQVILIDSDGFEAPATYYYPIFNVVDPLAAPKINTPIRQPASDKKKQNKSSWLEKLFNLVIPQAAADSNKYREVTLNWSPVEGADFYIIEISTSPDFESLVVNQRVDEAQFVWKENFVQDVYYMRVAGGSKDGRMGLFSQPQSVDMKKLAVMAQPQATEPVTETAKKPTTNKVANVEKEKLKAKTQQTKVVEDKTSPPGKIKLGSSFHFIQFKRKSDFEANFIGFAMLYSSLLLEFDKIDLNADLNYIEWQPKSVDSTPYQPDLSSWQYQVQSLYKANKTWSYGLEFKSNSVLAREDLEEISVTDELYYGFVARHQSELVKWPTTNTIAINYGDSHYQIELSSEVTNSFNWEDWKLFYGIKLDAASITGDEYESLQVDFNLFIGSSW